MAKTRKHLYETKQKYEGGATRSFAPYAFHLVPPTAVRAQAERWALGMTKHGEGNWKHGGVAFIKQCFNHLQNHFCKELESKFDPTIEVDDNLGAMLWNAGALTWFKKYKNKEYNQALDELHKGLFEKK